MTSRPVLTLIAAVSADGFISTGTGVPWHLPRDKEHFRRITRGQWLLLGRRTYEEMTGWFEDHHPLILTRSPVYVPPAGEIVSSVAEALMVAAAGGARELFVCGGGEAYAAAMPSADRLILTHVDSLLGSGVPFPTVNSAEWLQTSRQDFQADSTHAQALYFATYERLKPPAQPPGGAL
ncbi:MAG: dihydrofolate reductase [Prosthecobacter sp.]|uniref:dihydrofolate reductase n=1 Tax=Prosthecobacter sp. TaxID=1965333 RepID=UPI00261D8CC7|nr:dihydrofolate reductase [Prosthecobacter sp.]MCF7789367.1 dihydrofolate reductase [Prosthecobacter sp.]